MDARRLGFILVLGGTGITLLALVWFVAAYADAVDMASNVVGDDYALELITCIYASSPVCQGAAMLSDGPGYSPGVFWVGVLAVLVGVAIRYSARRNGAAVSRATSSDEAANTGVSTGEAGAFSAEILGFIPPDQYARYGYILALSGAVGGLLLAPLAVLSLAGCVLAVLGLSLYRPQVSALNAHHLGLICLIFVAAALLLMLTRGTFLFLLAALAQIAAFHVAFRAYRHGRTVTAETAKNELLMAFKPGSVAKHEGQGPEL